MQSLTIRKSQVAAFAPNEANSIAAEVAPGVAFPVNATPSAFIDPITPLPLIPIPVVPRTKVASVTEILSRAPELVTKA